VLTLSSIHVNEMHANPSLATMPHDCPHLQFPGCPIFIHSEVHLNYRSHLVLPLAQDAHPHRAHVRQEARRKLARRPEQHSPIGGAAWATSAV
jgi:hypothetical protein